MFEFEVEPLEAGAKGSGRSRWVAIAAGCCAAVTALLVASFFFTGPSATAQTSPTLLTSPITSSIEWFNLTGEDQVMYVDCTTTFSFPYFSDFLPVEAGASLRFEIENGLAQGCRVSMLNIPDQQLVVTSPLQSRCDTACFSWLPSGTDALVAVTLVPLGATLPDPPNENGPDMDGSFFVPRVVYPPATTLIDVLSLAVPLSAPVNPDSLRILNPGSAGVVDIVDAGPAMIRHTVGDTLEPVDWIQFELCDTQNRCSWYDFEIEIAQGPDARDVTWEVPSGVDIAQGVFHVDDLTWAPFASTTRYVATQADSIQITRMPERGGVEVVPDVWFRYTPETGFEGVDSFDYRACDATGLCDTATITLVVGDPPPSPTPAPTLTPTPNPSPPPGAEGCTIWGTDGNDILIGTDGDDVICGLDGDDVIKAGPGDDVVYGGDGDDDIRGQRGDDELRGGRGNDRLRGGPGADIVYGNSGAGGLWGNSGADTLKGGSGPDRIRGGSGSDRIIGGSGKDTAWGGSGSDRIWGKRGADRLKGGRGKDRIWGGSGNDLLDGGSKVDRLNGGKGFDTCLRPDTRTNCEAG